MSHQASEEFRAVKITVAGVVEKVSLDRAQLLQSLYAQIGCRYVEVVQPTDTICLWVDEEGLINRAEPNLVASFLAAALGVFGQVLHGTVVVTGGGDEAGDTLPLSDRDLRILETIVERLPSWTETRCRP